MVYMKRRILLLRYIAIRTCQSTWEWLRNLVRSLQGREREHDERLIFFRQYMLHLTGLQRIRAITSVLNPVGAIHEGAGCQAFVAMWTIATARACGWKYLHTPFSLIAHADRPMPEWVAAWEELFNLGAGEARCDPETPGVLNNGYGVGPLDLCFGRPRLRQEIDDSFKALIPEFRRKFYANKSRGAKDSVTVAVHLRRGDVSEHQANVRFTSTQKVLRMASAVKSILDARGIAANLRIYSQGDRSEFDQFSSLGAEYFLDSDPFWTVQELAEADVLIVAKSYFSYYAGVISEGIKIYEPCGRPETDPRFSTVFFWTLFSELDDWLPCETDGSIDHAEFEKKLARLPAGRSATGKE